VGCAATIASIELLTSPEILKQRDYIAKAHLAFRAKIQQHPAVKQVRCKGVILAIDLAIEMQRYGNLRDELYQFFMDRGVALRPLGNTLYVLPPYVITKPELDTIYSAIEEALTHYNN
jgi:adenosylmethionine-8-amino-7-oxononanoate aminotransferase